MPEVTGMHATFNSQAMIAVGRMKDRVINVRAQFGENSPEYIKSVTSLAMALTTVIGLGGDIRLDGLSFDNENLTLIGHNEYGFVYGMNYDHRNNTWSVNS